MSDIVAFSELAQGILIPIFAFILVAEAMLMRMLTRQIVFLRLELEAIKRATGIDVSITRKP